MKIHVLGIDVGGTNIKLGLVDATGNIILKTRLKTQFFHQSQKKLIAALCEACLKLIQTCHLRRKDIAGIGLGLPGLIDPEAGKVHFLPNIPGWRNVSLKNIIPI